MEWQGKHSHLHFVLRMCPARFERPVPIIWTEVASLIAVPKVAWETTGGIDGLAGAMKRRISSF